MGTPQRLLAAIVAVLLGSTVLHAQFVWTGSGGSTSFTLAANWRGLIVPPSSSTSDVDLRNGLNRRLVFSSAYTLRSFILGGTDQPFYVDAASPTTITLSNGISNTTDDYNQLWFLPNITLNLSGAQTLDARAGQILVSGTIAGSSPVSLISSSNVSVGFFIFNNTGAGNTYTGPTTFGDGVNGIGVAFWNSHPFGTGAVTLNAGATFPTQFISHGTQTLTNAITVGGSGLAMFKSWDAPLTLSGAITLATNATFTAQFSQSFLAAPNQAGSVPQPGAVARNPIVFSGNIGESGGARNLTFNGPGITYLTGTSTYTGGTSINGTVVYGSNSSAPTAGTINMSSGGYVGFADATTGQFAAFLAAHVNTAGASGAIGIDTLPGNSTVSFSDSINLTGYNAGLRIGTASTAIITVASTITPQGAAYQFGNGGGTLFVQSNLMLPKALTLSSSNGTVPLTLYLQGNNTYSGPTFVGNGFLIFDGASSMPATLSASTGGSSTVVGASYVGYTDATGVANAAAFLSKLIPANNWGIIGFDTHQGNSTVTINGVNLTGFNNGVFIGTTTSAILTGTLTPSTVVNSDNTSNTLRFTAAQSGVLTVNSTISGGTSVIIGSPAPSGPYSSGTVIMNGPNTYTGGTIVNAFNGLASPTLAVGSSTALGTGPLDIRSDVGAITGLRASAAGVNLANTVFLNDTSGGMGGGPQLFFTGTNAFTLSGTVIGNATTALELYNSAPLTVTLSGDNSGFLGSIVLFNGALNLQHNNAAGLGTLVFGDLSTATVSYGGAATAPVLYGISGTSGNLVIPSGNLTFDVSDGENRDEEFGGVISGAGSLTITAPTASGGETLYLLGNNTYSGGTFITNKGVLALGSNTGAGTGTVTLNSASGGIALNSGVTFSNPLVFTTGTLAGFGTFAPSGTSNITFNTGRIVAPGLPGISEHASVGTLTLNTDVTFANGGTFVWSLQDVTRTDGASLLNINGNLFITASGGTFLVQVFTFDANDNQGLANLTLGTPYSIPVITASGTITGFNPTAFTIDSSMFQGGSASPTVFNLSQSGSTIYLNFTPVPEPSTYALFALGCGAMLIPALRRKRR